MHQLRHAFCSHALMQGIDPRTVQKWMGHKDLNTTLRYAHVSPDHEKAAIQQLRYDHGHYMDTKTENGH
jgi:site-specific recombinase XerD